MTDKFVKIVEYDATYYFIAPVLLFFTFGVGVGFFHDNIFNFFILICADLAWFSFWFRFRKVYYRGQKKQVGNMKIKKRRFI